MWTVDDLEKVRAAEDELKSILPDAEVYEVLGKAQPVAVRASIKEKGNKKAIAALEAKGWKSERRFMGLYGAYYIRMRKKL